MPKHTKKSQASAAATRKGRRAARGSAIHGATYHQLDEANAALCAENAQLQEVVRAAWRLRFYGYHDWAMAGGVDNCPHGIGSGIHCARCDELLLRRTYESMTSPNARLTDRSDPNPKP